MRKTLNQIIICALLMINTFNYNTIAQDILPTPPTPQSAQFMRYGEIPVGHTTGVPQIEIPIYTINTGIIDIPISISYHASGFKVNDVASPVGLGWVVNANGWLISRIVHGSPDHLYQNCRLDSENTIRTPEDLEKVKTGEKKIDRTDFSNPYSAEFWHTYFIKNGDWPVSDVRSDRYFYSIPWHMGTAQYSADNMDIGLQTIPYEPLVFNYNTKENYYTITDTKGIIYTFAKKEHNKPDGEKRLISGWYLTSIKFPQLTEEVIFTYKEGKEFTTQNYIQTDIYYYGGVQRYNAVDNVDPYTPIHNVQGRGYATKPILLSEIKWKNTIVRFTYTTDRDDKQTERLTQINVINKIGDKEENIKQVKFNNNTYFGTKKANHRLKLSGVEFPYSGEKYTFNYDESKNSSLPAYYGYEGSPHSTEDYWGYWNGTNSSYWVFPQAIADYINKSREQRKIQGVDKNSNLEYTKACVLTDIVYPTKGKTHFEYELNPGTFNSSNIKTKDGKIGGLRVTRITNYTEDGSVAGIKEYEYSGKTIYGEYNNNNFSFEHLFIVPKPFVDFYSLMEPGTSISMAQLIEPETYTSTPLQCFFDASKSLVFYNKIIEYNGTKSNNNGYTIYNYTKASDRVSTNSVNYCGPHELLAFVKSVDCDFGYDKGILTLQTTYDKNGKIKHQKSISYSNYVKTLKTGVRMDLYLDVEGSGVDGGLTHLVDCGTNSAYRNSGLNVNNNIYNDIILNNIIAVQTYAYQTISDPTSETEYWYDENGKYLTKTSIYEYHKKSDGLPTISKPVRISITNSNGLKYDEYNTYACQKATEAPYKEMISKNMHEYLIENTTNVYNTSNESIKTPYQKIGNLYLPKTLIKDNVQRVEVISQNH